MKLDPRPDGLFVANNLGDEVCDLLRKENVTLGKDLHVVVGDTEEVYEGPPLPIARINILAEEIGAAAIDMLAWRLEHPRAPRMKHLVESRIELPGKKEPTPQRRRRLRWYE